jgi:hypothetical protein
METAATFHDKAVTSCEARAAYRLAVEANDLERVELAVCRDSVVHWVNQWCYTCDPRDYTVYPFDLWPAQERFLRWLDVRVTFRESGLVEKSRDAGITWLCAAYGLHQWLFRHHATIGYGSRKLEYVDRLGDLKSTLEKVRFLLYGLPQWMLPVGFQRRKHDNHCRILNPEKGCAIVGEGGDEIGRGDRAQPLDSLILTPDGFVRMGDLKVGDLVIGASGTATEVTGVFPQGIKPVYRVRFSDGAWTECCDDHLWQVMDRSNRIWQKRPSTRQYANGRKPFQVLKLSTIRSNLKTGREHTYSIPMVRPVQFSAQRLPLHPYVLGCLLGDGDVSNVRTIPVSFCCGDADVVEAVQERLPQECRMIKCGDNNPFSYRISDMRGRRGRGHPNPVKLAVKQLGLAGTYSETKFIPTSYLLATPEERLELLRGLMDTDGWATKQGGARYVSTSVKLVQGVAFLVRSLGGTVRVTKDEAGEVDSICGGRPFVRKPFWTVVLAMPAGMNPFRMKRKAERYVDRTKYQPSRFITSVKLVGEKPVQCIRVAAEDHLYVTDRFIVTHNTSLYFVDEAARLLHPEMAEAALSATTNVRVDVSTPNGQNYFWQKRMRLPPERVCRLHWTDDPRKTQEWAAAKRVEIGDTKFAEEYDIDYAASVEGVVIPAAWVACAVNFHIPEPEGGWGRKESGYDVAEEGAHNNVVITREGPTVRKEWIDHWGHCNTTQSAWRARDVLVRHGSNRVRYDAGGVGSGIKGTWDTAQMEDALDHQRTGAGRVPFKVVPVNFGGAPSDDRWPDGMTSREKFQDLGAEMWWSLRARFERVYEVVNQLPGWEKHRPEDMVSIPDHPQLIAELPMRRYHRTATGKIALDKKSELPRSPDFADAVVMCFHTGQKRKVGVW